MASEWTCLPKHVSIGSAQAFVAAIRKKTRPKFSSFYAACVRSAHGKERLLAMMRRLEGTPSDVPFADAILEAGIVKRNCERNATDRAKVKKHRDAIDFGLGEQNDGAANELRGCTYRKSGESGAAPVWQPPDFLRLDRAWRISDARIFELVEAAQQERGPLAESVNRKKHTTSTSNGRVATFLVDYFAAMVVAFDREFADSDPPSGHL